MPAEPDDLTAEELRRGIEAADRVAADPTVDPEIRKLASQAGNRAHARLLTME